VPALPAAHLPAKAMYMPVLGRKAELGTGLNIIFANFAPRTTTKQYHVAIIAL